MNVQQQGFGFTSTVSRQPIKYVGNMIPAWAEELTRRVLADEDWTGNPPSFEWVASTATRIEYEDEPDNIFGEPVRGHLVKQRKQTTYSSGVTWPGQGRILIRCGTDAKDAKLVLLHELAHFISPVYEKHGRRFWQQAWTFYFRYMPEDEDYCLSREQGYKRLAGIVYREMRDSLWTVRGEGAAS